jgi:hypothetical protein
VSRLRGTLIIVCAFLLGFLICAAVIMRTTHTASINPDPIPLEVRARHLLLPLLGPFTWSLQDCVHGSEWLQAIWTLALCAGLVFARTGWVVVPGTFAAFTWPLSALPIWALTVS